MRSSPTGPSAHPKRCTAMHLEVRSCCLNSPSWKLPPLLTDLLKSNLCNKPSVLSRADQQRPPPCLGSSSGSASLPNTRGGASLPMRPLGWNHIARARHRIRSKRSVSLQSGSWLQHMTRGSLCLPFSTCKMRPKAPTLPGPL